MKKILQHKNGVKVKTIKALRIDDIGASTKIHERYSKKDSLNLGFLRDRRLFGAWGPYREMTADEWHRVFDLLLKYSARITIAVTATWVEKDGTLTPFPEKYPYELAALKTGLESGLLEIACHGLTHCVLENKAFLPKLTGSNRKYHREFWDWLPAELHLRHLEQAIQILENSFERKITVLVPPGNVYSAKTIAACRQLGIKTINCNKPKIFDDKYGINITGNDNVLDFHDRDIVINGISWLEKHLKSQPYMTTYKFISEL